MQTLWILSRPPPEVITVLASLETEQKAVKEAWHLFQHLDSVSMHTAAILGQWMRKNNVQVQSMSFHADYFLVEPGTSKLFCLSQT
jgi:hypothetical protein